MWYTPETTEALRENEFAFYCYEGTHDYNEDEENDEEEEA